MSENNQEEMDKCPIDGNFFVPKAGKKVCSPECKKLWDSQTRRQRKLTQKLEAERQEATDKANREAENAKRRKARAEKRQGEYGSVVKLGGQTVACQIISRHFFGLFTKVKFPAQLDYGYPAFSETRTVASWRVK